MGYKHKDEHILFQGITNFTISIQILKEMNPEEKPEDRGHRNIGEQHHQWHRHHRNVIQWNQLLRQGSSLPRRKVCVQCDAGRHLLLCQCRTSVPVIQ